MTEAEVIAAFPPGWKGLALQAWRIAEGPGVCLQINHVGVRDGKLQLSVFPRDCTNHLAAKATAYARLSVLQETSTRICEECSAPAAPVLDANLGRIRTLCGRHRPQDEQLPSE